jgi:hypothetical protein
MQRATTRPTRSAKAVQEAALAGWATATLALLALTVASPGSARADGGYVSPFGYPVWEPGQTAFLRHDAGSGIEELTILPRFFGEPTDFAWLVPVPSLPEVAEADPELFEQLSRLTAPIYRSRDSFWNCDPQYTTDAGGRGLDEGGVEIIADELIGIYRTQTVAASDADALSDSLAAWGFLHEGNLTLVAPVLQQYVDEGWYFVAMSVDSTAAAAALRPYGKSIAADAPYYWYPALQPMTFRFASAEPIYPLRISQLSTGDSNPVSLYVATGHRVEFPGARTLYANRLGAGEHAAIVEAYPAAGAALDQGLWLTRLYRAYTAPEMIADLVLVPAADQAEVRVVYYSGLPVWSLVFGGATAWWTVRRRRMRRKVVQRQVA